MNNFFAGIVVVQKTSQKFHHLEVRNQIFQDFSCVRPPNGRKIVTGCRLISVSLDS